VHVCLSLQNLLFVHNSRRLSTSRRRRMSDPPPPLSHDAYAIILYYCYVPLEEDKVVANVMEFHESYRPLLGGRVRVSKEGLNGVLSGKRTDLTNYAAQLSTLLLSFHCDETTSSLSEMLDVKYCDLRPELPAAAQLFTTLSVQKTRHVVQLVDDTPANDIGKNASKTKRNPQEKPSPPQPQPLKDHSTTPAAFLDVYQASLACTAERLSPDDWNERLLAHCTSNDDDSATGEKKKNIVLLDCRNSYESDIGHFVVPSGAAVVTTTLLSNTRKFSELPQVLAETQATLQAADEIYMYCTGGVRCERASGYLQTLLHRSTTASSSPSSTTDGHDDDQQKNNKPIPKVYQLHGGIQRYLERERQGGFLYRGKNFVFDPRRVDPHVGVGVTGRCLVCDIPHDDYDNGRPSNNEDNDNNNPAVARCCKCRVLMLVCESCRIKVSCWGDEDHDSERRGSHDVMPKRLYCGGSVCWHRPPPRLIVDQSEGEKQEEQGH
jgi:predicted sulfurtransferase